VPRYFLDIAYNGTAYHGWQIQENSHTVQAELQKCLSTLLRTPVEIMGSGRTDTGVHATHQIAHFDTAEPLADDKLVFKLNSFLPKDISIQWIREVTKEAHTRFDAIERSYEYLIHPSKSPFLENLSYYYPKTLDISLMNAAAEKLLGEQNFESFSKVKTEVNTFICTIKEARWEKQNDSLVFHVTANRFLRGMVRALVGTLLDVGLGKLTVDNFVSIIESRDRKKAGRAVPAHGLYLTKVAYSDSVYID
jgi:tRNA pseudouridine38-40 synthase